MLQSCNLQIDKCETLVRSLQFYNQFYFYAAIEAPPINTKPDAFKPRGGLLKYDLGRDVPLSLEKVDPFSYQILQKNETHFYTRATKFTKNFTLFSKIC